MHANNRIWPWGSHLEADEWWSAQLELLSPSTTYPAWEDPGVGGGGSRGAGPLPLFGPRCRLFNIGPKVVPPPGPPSFACRPIMDPLFKNPGSAPVPYCNSWRDDQLEWNICDFTWIWCHLEYLEGIALVEIALARAIGLQLNTLYRPT